MKLLVRNLTRSITEKGLQELFEKYGVVESCDLVLDKSTRKSKGFGFVEMPNADEAKTAIKQLNGKKFVNHPIRVKQAD
ncbi:MAG TPA: RNA-binding protein [Balneola sp.]|jgi:RNA recognition motif-containing protein|nr:RNA-binding protein [Balneola sp.]MAO77970.1 RNA-binding protein [Balneola sp.]MBF65239.1 RNA-binding protein [Balneola sp.]HAW79422.1 RNA-binding protein [Balneola sp.]HBZ38965.1 RNA-binding protein [Balneola sp.]|tara:strand:+ start:2383 stop:2619 length:237 start_codon:yes stop_codon:yes gene_type:complete